MAENKQDKGGSATESLVKTAEGEGLSRPVAEDVVKEVTGEDVAPDKLQEVVKETAAIEKEDRELASGQKK